MNYLSLFSGIEAASVAWHDFGWTCVGVSEIDPFPCAVLKERFPTVPNLGSVVDITKEKLDEIKEEHGTIDIVVGGSPCQSFSLAGKRLGLEDPRGNLMFEYCRIVRTVRPKYFIWENVPGALSSNKGRDFSALIGEMVDIGYSLCWRVLDAQHFGVPQRRRRVFLVGCLGENTSGQEILFEREGCERDLSTGRETRKDHPTQVANGIREHVDQEIDREVVYHSNHRGTPPKEHKKCPTLLAWMGTGGNNIPMMIEREYYEHHQQDSRVKGPKNIGNTVTATYGMGGGNTPLVLETTLHESRKQRCGYDEKTICPTLESAMGTGGGNIPLVLETTHENAVYLSSKIRTGGELELKVCPTLTAQTKSGDTMPLTIEHQSYNITFCDANGTRKDRPNSVGDTRVVEVTAPVSKGNGECWENYNTFTSLSSGGGQIGQGYAAVRIESKVRRLTPVECERLQGFPDNWTEISYRGKSKDKCPMSPRYKALGNSMAVPVMRFIGLGIKEVENQS